GFVSRVTCSVMVAIFLIWSWKAHCNRDRRSPMVEAVMLWNEPNNLSHWDFNLDPDWRKFAEMAMAGARAVRQANPELKIVLGGMSPIDPKFMRLMEGHGVLDNVDVVAVHGFPLDWNHWSIHDWPKKLDEIRVITD